MNAASGTLSVTRSIAQPIPETELEPRCSCPLQNHQLPTSLLTGRLSPTAPKVLTCLENGQGTASDGVGFEQVGGVLQRTERDTQAQQVGGVGELGVWQITYQA